MSIASVALANGMNANLLRRWVNDRERSSALQSVKTQRPVQTMAGQFVPVALSRPEHALEPIRIEIRKGGVSIAMSRNWRIQALIGIAGRTRRGSTIKDCEAFSTDLIGKPAQTRQKSAVQLDCCDRRFWKHQVDGAQHAIACVD